MKKALPIFFLLFCSGFSNAQNYIDLAKFDYSVSPSNTFNDSVPSTDLQEMNGDLTAPLVLNDKSTFLTGVIYENFTASFNPERAVESFSAVTLKLGINIKHNSKWSGTYMFLPKISSDFKKIHGKDYQFGGAVLLKYNKSEHLQYKFGAYANAELFGPFVVPLFGLYYLSPSKKFEAKILLPLSGDLSHSIGKSMRFGMSFRGQIRTYNVNTPFGNEADRYLVRSAKDAYSYLQYELKNGVNLQLGFGRSVGRLYSVYSEKVPFALPLVYFDDEREQLNTEFSDGWLFKVGVFYRLKLDND